MFLPGNLYKMMLLEVKTKESNMDPYTYFSKPALSSSEKASIRYTDK